MNGADLYEAFKDALGYLLVSFHKMDDAQVTTSDGKLWLSANGRSCAIEIPKREREVK